MPFSPISNDIVFSLGSKTKVVQTVVRVNYIVLCNSEVKYLQIVLLMIAIHIFIFQIFLKLALAVSCLVKAIIYFPFLSLSYPPLSSRLGKPSFKVILGTVSD